MPTTRSLVLEGIPHSLRTQIWMRLSGAQSKRSSSSSDEVTYKQIVRASASDHLMTSKQIEKDLLRTLPNNICFSDLQSNGVPRLRRVLRGIAWLYPDIGYCQVRGREEGKDYPTKNALLISFRPSSKAEILLTSTD